MVKAIFQRLNLYSTLANLESKLAISVHASVVVRFVRYKDKVSSLQRLPANHFRQGRRGSWGVGECMVRAGQTGITFDTGDNVAQLNLDAVFCLHAINIMRVFPICHANQRTYKLCRFPTTLAVQLAYPPPVSLSLSPTLPVSLPLAVPVSISPSLLIACRT